MNLVLVNTLHTNEFTCSKQLKYIPPVRLLESQFFGDEVFGMQATRLLMRSRLVEENEKPRRAKLNESEPIIY